MKLCVFKLIISLGTVFSLLTGWGFSQSQPYANDRVIAVWQEIPSRSEKASVYKFLNVHAIGELPKANAEVWRVPLNKTLNGVYIRNVGEFIEFAHRTNPSLKVYPDILYKETQEPNDQYFQYQWGLESSESNNSSNRTDVDATRAWEIQQLAEGVVIGITDSGIDWTHPDLIENIWQNMGEDIDRDGRVLEFINGRWQFDPDDEDGIDSDNNGYIDDFIGWDFFDNDNNPYDEKGHGTHVAGIIGAKGNNQIGIAGMCWETQLMALKFMNEDGIGYSSGGIEAFAYAQKMGADLVNCSWGSSVYDSLLYTSILNASSQGQLFVSAAGNYGDNSDRIPIYPAAFPLDNIISVGAHNERGRISGFSNYGLNSVDIFAPGEGIYSTLPQGEYGFQNGTSMSAPFVTGALALGLQSMSDLDPLAHKQRLLEQGQASTFFAGKARSESRLNVFQYLNRDMYHEVEHEAWQLFVPRREINDITDTEEDLWISTNAGLVRLNKADSTLGMYHSANAPFRSEIVHQTCVDGNGNIWVATSSGLLRYDQDQTWSVYNKTNSILPSNDITTIKLDNNQHLWIGTALGLVKFDGTSWNLWNYTNSSLNAYIYDIDFSSSNYVWLATAGGLIGFDGENEWTLFNTTNTPLPLSSLSCVWVDHADRVWAGLRDWNFVAEFSDNLWTIHNLNTLPLTFERPGITSIAEGEEEQLWFGTYGGVVEKNINGWSVSDINEQLPGNRVKSLYRGQDERLWVSIEDDGLYGLQGENWDKYFPRGDDISTKDNLKIYVDRDNKIWILGDDENRNDRSSIHCYDRKSWRVWNRENSFLSTVSVTHIFHGQFGQVWARTPSQGFLIFNGQDWEHYHTGNTPELPSNIIQFIRVDRDNNAWIMTQNGIVILDAQGNWTPFDIAGSGYTVGDLGAVQVSPDGTKYFILKSYRGLLVLKNNGEWEHWTTANTGMLSTNIHSTIIDLDGNLWIATPEGLVKYDGNSWKVWRERNNGANLFNVSRLRQGLNGDLWMTSNARLARISRNETWTYWDENNSPLPSLWDMRVDSSGVIWVASNQNGIFTFNPNIEVSFASSTLSACIDDTVYFSNTSSSSSTFEWKVNGLSMSTGKDFSFSWDTPGLHKVELISKDTLFHTESFFQHIYVQAKANVSLGNDTLLCASQVLLTPTSSENIASYHWLNFEGDTLGHERQLPLNYSEQIILAAIDECGFTARDSITVLFTGNDCVWPGDVNTDGQVDMQDFLLLGLANGQEGPARQDASTDWGEQIGEDWNQSFSSETDLAENVNFKHADCDGDGNIDIERDKEVVKSNMRHALNLGELGEDSLQLHLRLQNSILQLGDTLWMNISVNNARRSELSLYGSAFSIDYHYPFSQPFVLDLANSNFGILDENLSGLSFKDERVKKIDIGIVRTDLENSSYTRRMARGGIIILVEDLENPWTQAEHIFFSLTYGDVLGVKNNGAVLSSTSSSTQSTLTATIELPRKELNLRVMLQGAFEEYAMHTSLRDKNLIPLSQPYEDGYPLTLEYLPFDMVDWVLVELRDPIDPFGKKPLERRPAILKKDGRIIDPISGRNLNMIVKDGHYYIRIIHRNHLPIMTAYPVLLQKGQVMNYDFTASNERAYSAQPMIEVRAGVFAMRAGDIDQNGAISYSGPKNDRRLILAKLPNLDASLAGYHSEDLNLDGKVSYKGEGNDREVLIKSVGEDDLTRVIDEKRF